MSIKQQHTHKSGRIRNSQPQVNFSNFFFLLVFSLIQVRVIQKQGQPDFNGEFLTLSFSPFCREYCGEHSLAREVSFKSIPANQNYLNMTEERLQIFLCFPTVIYFYSFLKIIVIIKW